MYAAASPACWARNSRARPPLRIGVRRRRLLHARRFSLPVVWVVWNNYAYASIRGLQRGYLKGRELATDFHNPLTGERYNPDFAAMARSAGVEGVRVDRAADLAEAVRKGIAAEKPYLIDVDIAADINPAGAARADGEGYRVRAPCCRLGANRGLDDCQDVGRYPTFEFLKIGDQAFRDQRHQVNPNSRLSL